MPITFSGCQISGGFAVTTTSPAILAGSMDINVADPNNTNDPALLNTFGFNSSITLGTGAFTIEFWMRPTAYGADPYYNRRFVFDLGEPYGTTTQIQFGFNWPLVGGLAAPVMRLTGNGSYFEVGPTLNLNTWYHVAITRSGTDFKVYINGTQTYNSTVSTDFGNSFLSIGSDFDGSAYAGYLTNFRIVKVRSCRS